MPAATAETEQTLSAPPAHRRYLARREELKLVKRRNRPILDNGEKVDEVIGEAVRFTDGQLIVPFEGELTNAQGGDPLDAAEIIKWLDKHPKNGNKEEGFWLYEEPAPAPSPVEQTQIVTAAEDGDAAGLEALIEQEEAGWHREDLLELMRGTLQRVEARQGERDAPGDALPAA